MSSLVSQHEVLVDIALEAEELQVARHGHILQVLPEHVAEVQGQSPSSIPKSKYCKWSRKVTFLKLKLQTQPTLRNCKQGKATFSKHSKNRLRKPKD